HPAEEDQGGQLQEDQHVEESVEGSRGERRRRLRAAGTPAPVEEQRQRHRQQPEQGRPPGMRTGSHKEQGDRGEHQAASVLEPEPEDRSELRGQSSGLGFHTISCDVRALTYGLVCQLIIDIRAGMSRDMEKKTSRRSREETKEATRAQLITAA